MPLSHDCISSACTLPAISTSASPRRFWSPRFICLYSGGLAVSAGNASFRTMSSLAQGKSRAFQLRQNPLSGESEWIVIDEEGDEESDAAAVPRFLLASTSYLDMLNDSRRNHAFRLAIEKIVTGPCHVLDIGAGTGLLSMMAARAMMKSRAGGDGSISACESYLPMVKLMRRVLRANGMEGMVKLFHKRSDELQVGVDLNAPADVLVSEILDSELLGEGLIPTLQHAHDMLLIDKPKTVPYRATTYGQLVECSHLWKLHDLQGNEARASDGLSLAPAGLENIIDAKDQQYSMHCSSFRSDVRLLSEPFKIFEFDFWKRPDSHGETEMWIKITNDGKAHAVVSWWVLLLDQEGSIFYSTAPRWIGSETEGGVDNWCDHWRQCVWFFPGRGTHVSMGSEVLFKAVHNDAHVSYSLKLDKGTDSIVLNSGSCLLLSPERIAIYGDKDIRSAVMTAIKNALQRVRFPLCVVSDDSVLLTILVASLSKTSNVISSLCGLQRRGYAYLEAVSNANGFSMDRIQVLGRSALYLIEDSIPRKVDILMAEPFYCGIEGMVPWKNLRFWKERSMLEPILSKDAIIIPYKGILRSCGMYIPDLWNSRCSLKEIEGLDHSVANEILGACGNLPLSLKSPCIACSIWQCGEYKELGKAFSVMEFDFREQIHACHSKIKMDFSVPGTCHGFALWIDWVVDEESSIIISTGPVNRYWKQGVKLLSEPVKVNPGSSVEIEASFDPSTLDITVESFP
ncbi:Protein arginine N-methyltransferase 7 [Apostasia shenzhenica]|uniref:Protein arginine N-methyltransferase 7 n=1 Tax=Apostasia shenzhenica TaxID=1088818 RepID=A0A2I0AYR1_9ASPA|nr:Protein arginine N-methyltransferase 7 [Apostasia shenzhenica]